MKSNCKIIVLLVWASVHGYAQTIVLPLYNPSDDFDTNGAYYKDLDGDLDKLVGIWEYENGNEHLKLNLQKKQLDKSTTIENIIYWEDALYGEYKYIDNNGIELHNSLDEMANLYPDISEHLIYGNHIVSPYNIPYCEDCLPYKRRVKLLIKDPGRDYIFYEMIVLHIPASSENNNIQQLRVTIKYDWGMIPEGAPDDDRLPTNQELILNKVN